MRTTLNIDDALLQQARQMAVQEHISLTRFIEESLSARFAKGKSDETARRRDEEKSATRLQALPPVFAGQGGLQAMIRDPGSLESVLDAIDAAGADA
ncbi:MAG: DUF2191 domain-containing protein [Zoogloeaceae bacterium]|jgi:hypothetical protein|nr:DUF2191 domain-containing protein [Zoogloeaceae bacterium]